MKKLEIIIQPEKLDRVREILEESDVTEYYMIDMLKNFSQKGIWKKYRGAEYQVKQTPQIKIEMVVTDEMVEALVSRIVKEISLNKSIEKSTANVVNGKIFIYDVQDEINI